MISKEIPVGDEQEQEEKVREIMISKEIPVGDEQEQEEKEEEKSRCYECPLEDDNCVPYQKSCNRYQVKFAK